MKTLLLTPEKGTYAILEPELTETFNAFSKLLPSKYGENSDILKLVSKIIMSEIQRYSSKTI